MPDGPLLSSTWPLAISVQQMWALHMHVDNQIDPCDVIVRGKEDANMMPQDLVEEMRNWDYRNSPLR